MLSIVTAAPDTSFDMNSSLIFSVVVVVVVVIVIVALLLLQVNGVILQFKKIPQIVIHNFRLINTCFHRRLRFRLYRQVRKPVPLKNAISAKRFFFVQVILLVLIGTIEYYRVQEKSFGIKMSKDDIAICKFDFALNRTSD